MNLKKYITQDFLFNINRLELQRSDKLFAIAGITAVVLAIVFKFAAVYAPSPVDAKYRNKFYNLFLYLGLAEIVWFGCRTQFVRLFGTHFIALLILAIAFVWFVILVLNMLENYKTEKAVWEKEQVKAKYLP